MDNEHLRFYILYDLRILKEKQLDIAKKYDVSKDTVTNIKKHYSDISDEELIELHENENQGCIHDIFGKKRKRTITEEELEAVKRVCLEILNCYYDPEELCRKLCKQKNVKFKDVYKYNPDNIKIDINDDINRAEYRKKIYSIRNRTLPLKNFDEAYAEFIETKEYKINQISYPCFYMYAKDFWVKADWEGTKLGDIIDKKIIIFEDEEPNDFFCF